MNWQNDLSQEAHKTRAAKEAYEFLIDAGETVENAMRRSGYNRATHQRKERRARA